MSRFQFLLQKLGAGLGFIFGPIGVTLGAFLRLLVAPFVWLWRFVSANPANQALLTQTGNDLLRGLLKPVADTPQSIGPQAILRPVNPWFVLFTLLAALALNLMPFGAWQWMPDFVALVLAFWCVRQPRLIGMGTGFVFGLLMDVHEATVLGEHCLNYVLLAYGAQLLSRRMMWFSLSNQALHMLPLFFGAQLLALGVRSFFSATAMIGWQAWLLAPFITAALWLPATYLLLAPQRRAIDIDETRPL